jgi:hypothetical protein
MAVVKTHGDSLRSSRETTARRKRCRKAPGGCARLVARLTA